MTAKSSASDTQRVTFHAVDVVRATPVQTFAWWTDLQEDDARGVMPPLRRRTIVRRTANETETEDLWSIFGLPMRTRAILRPHPPDSWEVETRLRGGTTRDTVRIAASERGTRVEMNLELDLRWPWIWVARAIRVPLGRLFQQDLEAVNRKLEASLDHEV